MNVGIILPGFSADESDWAIPVQAMLVGELARQDRVRVLALRYPARRAAYAAFGADVMPLGAGQRVRGLRRLTLWLEALRRLAWLHRRTPFDVLHAMWADECGLVAAWAGRALGVPVIVSIAGGELVGLPEYRYGLQRSAFGRWTVGQALHGADKVIAACAYARGLIARAGYAVPAEKVRTIPLGVDADHFSPACGWQNQAPRHLMHAASLIPVKDQPALLHALARLPGVTLDIAGDGPEHLRLVALAADLGLEDRIRWLGAIPYPAMPDAYRRAALHVFPSRHEGQGMVTLEAAACAIPTVGTAVGLLPDHPALGVAVPVGDDAALAEAIRALLDDPARRVARAGAARETVLAQFTVRHTAARLRELYGELV